MVDSAITHYNDEPKLRSCTFGCMNVVLLRYPKQSTKHVVEEQRGKIIPF